MEVSEALAFVSSFTQAMLPFAAAPRSNWLFSSHVIRGGVRVCCRVLATCKARCLKARCIKLWPVLSRVFMSALCFSSRRTSDVDRMDSAMSMGVGSCDVLA